MDIVPVLKDNCIMCGVANFVNVRASFYCGINAVVADYVNAKETLAQI